MKIFVKAKTQARECRLEKISDLDYTAYVKEPPQAGKANNAILELLAEHFRVSRSRVRLILGKTAKDKLFEIKGI